MKSGIKTSEFWFSLLASVAVLVIPSIQQALEVELGSSHWAVAGLALAYTVVRHLGKRDDIKAKKELALSQAPLENEPSED